MSIRQRTTAGSTAVFVVLLLVLTYTTPSSCSRLLGAAHHAAAPRGEGVGAARRSVARRALLQDAGTSATGAVQCSWIPGTGCALGPSYVAKSLANQPDVPVAKFLAASLTCAAITNRGACSAAGGCTWDSSYADGQTGCFLSATQLGALQQQCAVPRYQPGAVLLQQCLARSGGCQCKDTASCAALLSTAGAAARCPSLLGCWLSSMLGSKVDVAQLVQVQLSQVLPLLDGIRDWQVPVKGRAGGHSSGRRLLQAPGMARPVMDAAAALVEVTTASMDAAALVAVNRVQDVVAEAAATSSALVGVSLPIKSVEFNLSALPSPPATPVAIPSPATAVNGGSNPGSVLVQESGEVGGSPGSPDGGGMRTPVASDDALDVGSVPLSFWKCVATAAASVQASKKYAALVAASRRQSLDAYMAFNEPLETMAWGVRVLSCFKDQATFCPAVKPFLQAYMATLSQLQRVTSDSHTLFSNFVDHDDSTGSSSAATDAADLIHTLVNSVVPDPLSKLAGMYGAGGAYAFDVVLQAQAVLTDMKWAAREAELLVIQHPEAAPAVLRSHMRYAASNVRRMLKWLLSVQFGVASSHAQGSVAATAGGSAAVKALDAAAAAYLPAMGVPLNAQEWQQARGMLVDALHIAANASTAAGTPALNASLALSVAVDALGAAHVNDLWSRRIKDATAAAAPAKRVAALADRSAQRSWSTALEGQMGMLQGLLAAAQALGGEDTGALDAGVWRLQMQQGAVKFVAAVVEGMDAEVPQGGIDSQLLALSGTLAAHNAACNGPAAGVRPPMRSSIGTEDAARQAACSALDAATGSLLTMALGEVGSNQPLWVTARADLVLQWHCNALPQAACDADAMCALGALPPNSTAAGAQGSLACEAANGALGLGKSLNDTVALMAASLGCGQLLGLPVCDGRLSSAQCAAAPGAMCQWAPGQVQAQLLVDSGRRAAALAGANSTGTAVGRRGDCALNWDAVLQKLNTQSQASLLQRSQQCQAQASASTCAALSAPLVGAQAHTEHEHGWFARAHGKVWLPLLLLLLAGGVLGAALLFVRRRRAAAAAEDATALLRHQRKRKGGKKRLWKRKIKRAEPGSYQRDLMRDSFTDYMRQGPGEFTIGAGPAMRDDGGGSSSGGTRAGSSEGGSGPSSRRSSFVENPLVQLQEEVGGRVLLAPGVGVAVAGTIGCPFSQGQQQGQQQQQGRQRRQRRRHGSEQGSPSASPRANSFSSLSAAGPAAAMPHASTTATLARRSIGRTLSHGAGAAVGRGLRLRLPTDGSSEAGDSPTSGCHDSVRTLERSSGAATPALSLSRESWTSLELVVTAQLPAAPQRDLLL